MLSVFAAGLGWHIAEKAEDQTQSAAAVARTEILDIGNILLQSAARQSFAKLESIATLPLLSEFLFFADSDPKGEDARELKIYLEGVLTTLASSEPPSAILVISTNGDVILSSESSFAETGSNEVSQTSPLIFEPETEQVRQPQLIMQRPNNKIWSVAPVADYNKPAAFAGYVMTELPDSLNAFLSQKHLVFMSQETGAPGQQQASKPHLEFDTTTATEQRGLTPAHFYAIFVGISCFAAGLITGTRRNA
ncbi:MAG: hypothetical protein HWE23_07635 [Rhodobacteraceae bacterium]|nr:hypothetical protein [Paracoccaceae bacterium]